VLPVGGILARCLFYGVKSLTHCHTGFSLFATGPELFPELVAIITLRIQSAGAKWIMTNVKDKQQDEARENPQDFY
jgi:hypothetical protein